MRKCLLVFFLGVTIAPVFSQTITEGTLTGSDGTFNRPNEGAPPTTLSITGTNVLYDAITVNIPFPSLVTFNSNSLWDNFLVLYGPGGFNPLAPLENALIANDDFNAPNAGFTYSFPVAGTYTLVICSFKNDASGAYTVTESVPIPLPLRLTSFTAARADHNTNLLHWTSVEESDLVAYQVQRGTDGSNFEDLSGASVAAKNNSLANTYNFTDNKPGAGTNYYRLKISERSGRVTFSPIAVVKNINALTTGIRLYPNPATDYVRIEARSGANMQAAITLVNAGGAIIQNAQYRFNAQSMLLIDVKKLPAGKYFLKTAVGGESTSLSFIKK